MAAEAAYVPKRRLAGQVSIKATPRETLVAESAAVPTDTGEGMPAPAKEINPVLLAKLWRDYAVVQKRNGRNSLHATLLAREPRVAGPGRISFAIVNEVQENYLRAEKPELLGHLRRELGEPALELEVVKEEVEVRPRYTAMDRFKLMAERNPALLTLRDAVGLDLG